MLIFGSQCDFVNHVFFLYYYIFPSETKWRVFEIAKTQVLKFTCLNTHIQFISLVLISYIAFN